MCRFIINSMKKRFFISLSLLLICALNAWSKPQFQKGKKYQIVCEQYINGCTSIGSAHGKETPVYYLENSASSEDCYWYITEEETGYYSIRNASTGQYITYTGIRSDGAGNGNDIRYVGTTTYFDEDDAYKSFWTFSVYSGNYFSIRNASNTNHIWDVRVSPSFVVGTYSNENSPNINQRFCFYDENGDLVENVEEVIPDPELGYNVSSWLVANTNSDSKKWENNGWSYHEGGYYNNGDASVVSPFYENWHPSSWGPLSDCSLTQTLEHLPAGDYILQADMIAVRQAYNWYGQQMGTGVTLFAGNQETSVSTYNEEPRRYTINFTIGNEGSVTLGVRVEKTNANWIAIDNIVIYYNGTEQELMDGEKAKIRADLLERMSASEIEEMLTTAGSTFQELEDLRTSILNMPEPDPLSRCAKDITIKGRTLTYVESLNLYLCSISAKHFGTDFTDVVSYTPNEGYGDMVIDGTPVASGSNHTFSNVSAGDTYIISFSNGSETIEMPITFTSLPVVQLTGEFSNSYSEGYIRVAQPNKQKAELLNMKAKWRGGITNSSGKNKRNYHVKLLDENGEKLEKRYFDLRKDNSWILESCQVDMSRIRNRVLTDLWNDYCTKPYYFDQEPEALTGTRGEFVELVLNNEYRGIYCMTENMDRKQMKLKKYDEETSEVHGQLWKSKDWCYATFMGTIPDHGGGSYSPKDYLSIPDNNSEMWDHYEVKYPDFDDVMPTDWSTLYDAVDFVCYSTDEEFKAHIGEYFDLPVVIDYYILMETILSTDNHGKNMFFGVYDKQVDKKITFSVWDMDATCGQRWSDQYYHVSFLGPKQDYATFIDQYEHGDYNLFKRLRDTDAENFNLKVRKRYRDLRQDNLATDSILRRFENYFKAFKTAGADQRESNRWSGDSDVYWQTLNFYDEYDKEDMDIEYNYIANWFTRRMNYLDTTRFDLANLPPSGDANGDGAVTIADVTAIVNYILGKPMTGTFSEIFADINGDGRITIADVTATVNLILGK